MPHQLWFRDDEIVRRDWADHGQGDALRARYRDGSEHRVRDGNDPLNEAFSFTTDEWELLRRTHPELFQTDPQARARAWRRWAGTSEGRAFRVR